MAFEGSSRKYVGRKDLLAPALVLKTSLPPYPTGSAIVDNLAILNPPTSDRE